MYENIFKKRLIFSRYGLYVNSFYIKPFAKKVVYGYESELEKTIFCKKTLCLEGSVLQFPYLNELNSFGFIVLLK